MAARDKGEPCRGAAGASGAALDGLPSLALFGEALVAAARTPDDLADLPSLANFGQRLVARVPRRRRRWRRFALAAVVALPVAATSGAATAVVLRETVVQAPDPAQVPDEQTPLAGTAVVSPVRASDPDRNGRPWAIRVAKSKTGFTCTTVGQVKDGTFGLVGLDGVFRRLPGELSDACGQGGTLTGARIVAANELKNVRSIVYGVAPGVQRATLTTATGDRKLAIGPNGTFVAALRGYPEDHTAGVLLTYGDHTERHSFAAPKAAIPDPDGQQAWAVDRFVMGTRYACANVRQARLGDPTAPKSPTACLGLRVSKRTWIADARTFHPGEKGTPGFDRWNWRNTPARTVVWGVARTKQAITKVTLRGAGAPRELPISKQGAFAAVLPASIDPTQLELDVTLQDGTTEHGRPGVGLIPDLVKSRRAR